MIHKRRKLALAVATLLAVTIVATVYAAGESLSRSVIGSGGGAVSNSSTALRGVLGQPVAGLVSNGTLTLCSGMECGPAATRMTPTATPTPDETASGTPTATTSGTPSVTPSGTPDQTPLPSPSPDETPGSGNGADRVYLPVIEKQ